MSQNDILVLRYRAYDVEQFLEFHEIPFMQIKTTLTHEQLLEFDNFGVGKGKFYSADEYRNNSHSARIFTLNEVGLTFLLLGMDLDGIYILKKD